MADYKYGHGWNFPVARVRPEESPQEAAFRSMRQGFSIRIPYARHLGELFCRFSSRRDLMYCFVSHISEHNMRVMDRAVSTANWFPITHLPENISPFAKEIVDKWFRDPEKTLAPSV